MGSLINLSGQAFSYLTVLHRSDRAARQAIWWCRCACGGMVEARGQHLRSGETKSCGCQSRGTLRHGHSGRVENDNRTSPTYSTWQAMLKRCNNPNEKNWEFYGALGVSVCDRWQSFENFLEDMGERPAGKTLDRYPDKRGNYEPSNCRWASKKQQNRNRSSTKLTQDDVDQIRNSCLSAKYLAEFYGVCQVTIYDVRKRKTWA